MNQNRNNLFSSYTENIKVFFRSRSVLSQLILINIIVWIFINILDVFFFLFQVNNFSIISFFALPSNIEFLLFKPWTLLTYMFLQKDFLHILFNIISLYFGGKIFLEFLDEKKLLSTYIFGGLTGGLFFILSYHLFPVFKDIVSQAILLGASASVVAIIVAVATYVPDYLVNIFLLGTVKLKYIAIALVILFTLSINKENPGGHLAHLGGAFWGFIYILQLRKGKDVSRIFDSLKNIFRSKPKLKVDFNEHKRPLSDEEYNRKKFEQQEKIDAILEKISNSGYNSLTKEEKALLFNVSNKKK